MPRDQCPGARSCSRGRRGAQKHLSNLLHVVQVVGCAGVGGCTGTVALSWPIRSAAARIGIIAARASAAAQSSAVGKHEDPSKSPCY
jgi:predicted metal-binding protein